MLFGHGVGYLEVIFHPVSLLLESHALHVRGVVGIVVDGCHGADLLIPLNEHALLVHIGESERAHHGIHAFGAAPFGHGVEESVRYLGVVDEIHEAEAHILVAGAAVHLVVDNAGDAAHRLSVAEGHECLCLAEVESRIFRRSESVGVIHHQRRHIIVVAFIEIYTEFHEFLKLRPARLYLAYLYCHCQ